MPTREWTTDTVPPALRFAHWREAVCDGIVGAETEDPAPGPFSARLSATRGDDYGFVVFSAGAHAIVRSPRLVRSGDGAPFLVNLQLAGESRYGEGDGAVAVGRGEIALVNTGRPFRLVFPISVSRVIAIVPRALLRARVPWCGDIAACKIDNASPAAEPLRAHLAAAARGAPDLRTAGVFVENLANLLALALIPDGAAARWDRAAHRRARQDALFAYIARNLANPELAPRHAADALDISLRLVHRLLADAGTSFGRLLLERRLDASRRSLDDPAQAARSISDIAFHWGFGDLSHFSRSFKQRYGMPPRLYRARRAGN
jgi:AraC family transcriptional activator of tynA and feaB